MLKRPYVHETPHIIPSSKSGLSVTNFWKHKASLCEGLLMLLTAIDLSKKAVTLFISWRGTGNGVHVVEGHNSRNALVEIYVYIQ